MKLELKHLVAYLPYNLKVTRNGFIGDLIALMNDEDSIAENFEFKVSCSNWWENNTDKNHYKPILRPLSDLIKDEFMFLFVDTDIDNILSVYQADKSLDCIEYYLIKILLKNHFDIYGLIEAGLAMDVNILNLEL